MSGGDLQQRRRVEAALLNYMLAMNVYVHKNCVEVCPDLYGVQWINPRNLETTVIELDKLA